MPSSDRHGEANTGMPLSAILAPDPELYLVRAPMTYWVDQDEDDPTGSDAGTLFAWCGHNAVYFPERVHDGDTVLWNTGRGIVKCEVSFTEGDEWLLEEEDES